METKKQPGDINLFSFVKSQVPILNLVQEYTTLKQAGSYWKGSCPFHEERTGSFTVSPHRGIFYCFGCHVSGDIIGFIEKAERLSPKEAALHLANRYNLNLPEQIATAKTSRRTVTERERHHTVCTFFAQWCHKEFLKHVKLVAYTENRGFTQKTITHFEIGYLPGGIRSINRLLSAAKQQNILAQDLLTANIIRKNGSMFYSPFEERLLFPIHDYLGRTSGFGGRVIKPQDSRAKYYNSADHSFFSKSDLLFGLWHGKKSIQKQGSVFLVEGYTDCLAMVQHGYANTVATLGTACTMRHLQRLARYAQTLLVLYDGDKAGQKAVLRLTELCWDVGLELSVITLPENHDPASYLQEHGSLDNIISKAQDIFSFFVGSVGKDLSRAPLAQRVSGIRTLLERIVRIEDPLKKDLLLHKVTQLVDMPLDVLLRELQRIKQPRQTDYNKPPQNTPKEVPTAPLSMLEKRLFSAILNNLDLAHMIYDTVLLVHVPPSIRSILQTLKDAKIKDPNLTFEKLYQLLNADEQVCVNRLLVEVDDEQENNNFEHLLKQFQKQHWKTLVNDIKLRIARAHQADTHEVQNLIQEFEQLKKQLLPKEPAHGNKKNN